MGEAELPLLRQAATVWMTERVFNSNKMPQTCWFQALKHENDLLFFFSSQNRTLNVCEVWVVAWTKQSL